MGSFLIIDPFLGVKAGISHTTILVMSFSIDSFFFHLFLLVGG